MKTPKESKALRDLHSIHTAISGLCSRRLEVGDNHDALAYAEIVTGNRDVEQHRFVVRSSKGEIHNGRRIKRELEKHGIHMDYSRDPAEVGVALQVPLTQYVHALDVVLGYYERQLIITLSTFEIYHRVGEYQTGMRLLRAINEHLATIGRGPIPKP